MLINPNCPECRGSGTVQLFTSRSPCTMCGPEALDRTVIDMGREPDVTVTITMRPIDHYPPSYSLEDVAARHVTRTTMVRDRAGRMVQKQTTHPALMCHDELVTYHEAALLSQKAAQSLRDRHAELLRDCQQKVLEQDARADRYRACSGTTVRIAAKPYSNAWHWETVSDSAGRAYRVKTAGPKPVDRDLYRREFYGEWVGEAPELQRRPSYAAHGSMRLPERVTWVDEAPGAGQTALEHCSKILDKALPGSKDITFSSTPKTLSGRGAGKTAAIAEAAETETGQLVSDDTALALIRNSGKKPL